MKWKSALAASRFKLKIPTAIRLSCSSLLAAEKSQDRIRLLHPAVQLSAFEFLHLNSLGGDTFEIVWALFAQCPIAMPAFGPVLNPYLTRRIKTSTVHSLTWPMRGRRYKPQARGVGIQIDSRAPAS